MFVSENVYVKKVVKTFVSLEIWAFCLESSLIVQTKFMKKLDMVRGRV